MIGDFRVGVGFDAHAFDSARPLILGGVRISDTHGLVGHSDADVVIHVIIDALLGAAGLGDIGKLFPDTDARFKDADSRELLRETNGLLSKHKWQVSNVDVTVICERPKIASYSANMRTTIAEILLVTPDQISVKGTTTERLGFTGREEGIAAIANVAIYRE